MRFPRATDALLFWWSYVQDGGVPLHPQSENPHSERVQESLSYWVPADELCTYIQIGKILDGMQAKDKRIISSWLTDVVGTHQMQEDEITRFAKWRYRDHFSWACRRFWKLLPQEHKYYGRRTNTRSKGSSSHPKHRDAHDVQAAKVREAQGLPSWRSMAYPQGRPQQIHGSRG